MAGYWSKLSTLWGICRTHWYTLTAVACMACSSAVDLLPRLLSVHHQSPSPVFHLVAVDIMIIIDESIVFVGLTPSSNGLCNMKIQQTNWKDWPGVQRWEHRCALNGLLQSSITGHVSTVQAPAYPYFLCYLCAVTFGEHIHTTSRLDLTDPIR